MLRASAKMSLEASDVQTDEDCEELVEDRFSLPVDISETRTRRKKSSGKPPLSRSPYLSSLNVNSRKAAVGAWRPPRASMRDTAGNASEEAGSARLTSLSNGHDMSNMLSSECDVSPQLPRQALKTRKTKQFTFEAEGITLRGDDYREKEDMYDEIIHLKKSLHAQKSVDQHKEAKLRYLEEKILKREKQIEELLDSKMEAECARSLDKKKERSVVVIGLKQKILKLEQQYREKGNALSKLQSELMPTNLEELKVTVKTYFEEIQRLRMLLQAAEKSSRAESKCSQRQQKALSSTVHRLSENLKQLQRENAALREEINTDSPAAGIKGYKEWSKQRLLRRLLVVEKRLEDSSRTAQPAKSCSTLEKEVQATLTEVLGFTMATEAAVSVGTVTEEWEEVSDVRERLSQLEKERVELQQTLSSKEQELQQLWARIQNLEDDRSKLAQAKLSSPPPTMAESHEHTRCRADQEEGQERDSGCKEKGAEGDEELGIDAVMKEREKAALIIQTNWRQHRQRDLVILQSVLRGHFLRESQLKSLLKDMHHKAVESHCSVVTNTVGGGVDVVAVTMIQSAFRGHVARCSLARKSSTQFAEPSLTESTPPRQAGLMPSPSEADAAFLGNDAEKEDEQEDLWLVSSTCISSTHTQAQTEFHSPAEFEGSAAADSDDSDDIIVSPSRPLRSREVFLL